MKKTISLLTVLSLLALCTFSSCKKSEFNPKMKISKVFESRSGVYWYSANDYETSSSQKSIAERWIWNGNQLAQMDFDGEMFYFFYEKNKLDRIEIYDFVLQMEYDGKYVKKVVGKESDKLVYEMEVLARDEHKITKAKYTIYYDDFYYGKDAKSLTVLNQKIDFVNNLYKV